MADLSGLRIGGAIDNKAASGGASAASQAEVDAGTEAAKYVAPLTLANASFHGKYVKNLLYHSLTHDIWQEGVTFNDIADDTYVADLWNVLHNGQPPDVSGVAGTTTDPFSRYFRCTFDSAASQAGIVLFLEAQDTAPLKGQTVSISADIWGTNVSNIRMAVIEWGGTLDTLTSDVVGTWGTGNPTLATDWTYIGTPASIAITSTRTRYEVENITVSIGTSNLAIFIWTPDEEASTDLFNIANVQLELGPVATAFVARLKPHEQAAVQTFIYSPGIAGMSAFKPNTNTLFAFLSIPTMRSVPTLIHNITGWNATGSPGANDMGFFNYSTGAFMTITGALAVSLANSSVNRVILAAGAGTSFNGSVGDIGNFFFGSGVTMFLSARL